MRTTLTILACSLTLAACGGSDDKAALDSSAANASAAGGDTGTAATGMTVAMRDAAGRDLGTVTLTEAGQSISLAGMLRGLPPGAHAIHVHTTGRCEPPFESAGGHWNPTDRKHGMDNAEGPHLGDMPNLTVAADSSVNVQASTAGGTLRGTNALLDADGAAIVIHAKGDDFRTDPSGNSGDRIACGVVSGS